ncbi:MAG: type II toxin-antitoxin system VapC family toxin [Nitrososphaerales archaeon]
MDTGVLYAFADKNDEHNLDAKAIMLKCLEGDFGAPVVIDYCVLETLALLQQRRISAVIEELLEFLRENRFTFFFVTEQIFQDATNLMIEKSKDSLSLTDCSQVVVSKEMNIKAIATFDGGLANFFETSVGKGSFDQLEEREKQLLSRKKGPSLN